ncbi:PilZ domain-containing protein [Poseidonocella sedimentorum]|uniref:PilZ domain-containing protein n=1 Tax=Poseidonocella sedimentorum TaxID=871652 RepID=A0A1I6DHA3_9RHOB|nr:PilZ domain-containing protein [Poseidonocella sedimentorum]SFR04806.1 PilZ domain-containing protein [Poseidonocella sedimentorum]
MTRYPPTAWRALRPVKTARALAVLAALCLAAPAWAAGAKKPEAPAGPVNSTPACQVMDKILALDPLSHKVAVGIDHFQLIDQYRTKIEIARQSLRALPASVSVPDRERLQDHVTAHADVAETVAINGSSPAAALITSEPFLRRALQVEADHKALGCLSPSWRDRLSFLTDLFKPVQRIWAHERVRPFILWGICFSLVVWARRRQKRYQALNALPDYDAREAPRVNCSLPAQVHIEADGIPIRILDISRKGARFALSRPVELPDEIHIALPAEIRRTALLRRMRARHGAVMFLPRLTDVEFAKVLRHSDLPVASRALPPAKPPRGAALAGLLGWLPQGRRSKA